MLAADRRYLLNGDWLIDAPGVYAGAGTTLHYSRTYENHETLEAEGPTAEELHILVQASHPHCQADKLPLKGLC